MKAKRWMGIAAAAALAASAMAGCGSGETAKETTAAQAAAGSEASEAAAEEASAGESSWPSGNVTLYVPAAAGGGSDMIVRLFAQAMNDVTGSNFVIINDETGAGAVAAETVRNGKPDGLTLYVPHTGFCGTISAGQYDHSFDDFTIIGLATTEGTEGNGIFVNADSPYETFEDFVAYAKENPGDLVGGVETNKAGHNALLLLQNEVGFETTIVDSGSSANRITSLMGGMVDFSTLPTATAAPYVESGDLRCLVTLGSLKCQSIENVPTIEECGYEPCDLPTCMILLGPAGMNQADVDKIHEYLQQANQDQTLQDGLAKLGAAWEYKTQQESIDYVHEMQEKFDTAYEIQNR